MDNFPQTPGQTEFLAIHTDCLLHDTVSHTYACKNHSHFHSATKGLAIRKLYDAGKSISSVMVKGTNKASEVKTPSVNTKVIKASEIKSPNAIKSSEVTKSWNKYLGPNQTNINPRTGQVDLNRIFSVDGTKSIRFGIHEMSSMGTTKFHYHMETWTYDAVNDTMIVTNLLKRIKE